MQQGEIWHCYVSHKFTITWIISHQLCRECPYLPVSSCCTTQNLLQEKKKSQAAV